MRNKKTLSVLLIALALVVGLTVVDGVSANQEMTRAEAVAANSPTTINSQGDKVLYTVVRGSYSDAVRAFNNLVQMRDDLGLAPAGDWGVFVYLEQPTSADVDRLIEVQIPVQDDGSGTDGTAQTAASQYQLGTSGVKDRPARKLVRITKPVGVSDPAKLYDDLYAYAASKNLSVEGSPYEVFAAAETIPQTCSIDELQTDIYLPVS
jgi:effector-binding domain-containing protein